MAGRQRWATAGRATDGGLMTDRPVAIVTGAARGIGAAVVRRLTTAGWSVVAVDRCSDDPAVDYPLARPEELTALAEESPHVQTLIADVREPEALAAASDLAVRRHGKLDAAVACAAVIVGGEP